MGGRGKVDLLMEAFDTFKRASLTLQEYYQSLEERIRELNLEIEEKNNYLVSILEGLPVGILVTDERGRVELANIMASSILDDDPRGRPVLDIPPFHLLDPSIDGQEVEFRGRDGKRRFLFITKTILRDLKGGTVGNLFVINDVTELKRLKEQAEREKRLSAMGEMAASIAHQIRNPLGSIELFASLLKDDPSPEDKEGFAEEIIKAVRRLNNTLSNMLIFANTSRPRKEPFSLKELVKEVCEGCRPMLMGRKGRVRTLIEGDPVIYADRELLKQAIFNLLVNALEATEEGGGVTVEARVEGESLHLLISDNGKGIKKEELERVFDPFFTTKPRGTGLGLTVVNNIIKAHEGLVEVESEEGKGTTFHITLKGVMDCV